MADFVISQRAQASRGVKALALSPGHQAQPGAAARFDAALARFYGAITAVDLCPVETREDEIQMATLCDRQQEAAAFLYALPAPDIERFAAKLRALVVGAWECPIDHDQVASFAGELEQLTRA